MNDQTTMQASDGANHILDLTSEIVIAFVSNTHVHVQQNDLSDLIKTTFSTLEGLVGGGATSAIEAQPAKKEPAVSIRASVKPDYLVCLHDGTHVKMLKRYLMTNFQQTPEQYRAEFNLPADYPMVAPNYSAKRRELAKAIGLGTKGRAATHAIEALADVTETDAKIVAAEAKGETAPKADAKATTGNEPAKRRGGRRKAATAEASAPAKAPRARKAKPEPVAANA